MRVFFVALILLTAGAVALWQLELVNLPFLNDVTTREAPQAKLFDIVKGNDLVALKAQLEQGSNVNIEDRYGQTPLMYAASEASDPAVLETLLDAGADINAQTQAGWSALMYAARDSESVDMVLALLNAGADPTLRNGDGQTAFDLANTVVRSSGLYRRLVEFQEDVSFNPDWPSGYTVPVEGATLSSRANHLPGAPRSYRNGIHEGFDFYAGTVSVPIEYGTPISAVANGEVIRADHDYEELTPEAYDNIITAAKRSLSTPPDVLDQLRGRQVWIRHAGGFVSRYAHLSDIPAEVAIGARVKQGSVIGFTGNSGTLEAAQQTQDDPHPHVEIWRGDNYLGQGLEPRAIYQLAAQVFGETALPPYNDAE